jgi:hypothetical protein
MASLTQPAMWGNDLGVRFPRLLSWLLIVVLVGLAPATYADPPDPTWQGGFWDDDDFDDVVILLDGTFAVVESLTVHAAPLVAVVAIVECAEPTVVPAVVDETAAARAPPLIVSAS